MVPLEGAEVPDPDQRGAEGLRAGSQEGILIAHSRLEEGMQDAPPDGRNVEKGSRIQGGVQGNEARISRKQEEP